jgi:hypothetical protein
MIKFSCNLQVGERRETITDEDLTRYADDVGLSRVAKDRGSWVFIMDVFLHDRFSGIEPPRIVAEVEALECGEPGVGTKSASEFKREPMRGLWHKHYSARFVARNIRNQMAGGKLEALANEIFDPQNPRIITDAMINELARRATVDAIAQRESAQELTGEWIVFAKHNNQNYYLCLATHESRDQAVYDRIKATCFPQFPFLSPASRQGEELPTDRGEA